MSSTAVSHPSTRYHPPGNKSKQTVKIRITPDGFSGEIQQHEHALVDSIRRSTALIIATIPLCAATMASVMPQLSFVVSCLVLSCSAEYLRPCVKTGGTCWMSGCCCKG